MRTGVACIVAAIMLMTCQVVYAGPAEDSPGWMPEFQRLCSYTDQAAELGVEELDRLIAGCGDLLEVLGALDEPRKKVYVMRLTKCRDLYVFTKDIKTRGQ